MGAPAARTERVVTPAPAIVIDARTAAEKILYEQQCGEARCKCAISYRRGFGLTHCPLHEDHSPSFNITLKDQKLLVCCEAGCVQEDVVGLLRNAGLWPQQAHYGKQIVAEYDYRDAQGNLLYQAVRYIPKDFRQRRPKGNDWDWSLGDTERVLYRLPELLDGKNRIVFVVEGEKDVDRLYAEGFMATCNVGGAGKWRDEYSQYLKGRHVVILPDNDEPGRQHGLTVANSLKGIAKTIRWLELPGLDQKEDVSDWFADGGTADRLRDLATQAGEPPVPGKREKVFKREGMAYRLEPAEAPVVARISRIADKRDGTYGELHITRDDGRFLLRRQVNLLAATGSTLKGIIEDLNDAEVGVDVDWKRVLLDGFEEVLDAHRNGLVIEMVGGDIAPPKPLEWFCDGLLLRNKMNCWLAAAGTGKSTLAKVLCVAHAAGVPFMGRDVGKGLSLYLDWEDDKDDLNRVAYEFCKAMGIWPVPYVGWISMKGKRFRDNVEHLGQKIAETGTDLIVLDAIAAAGGAQSEHTSWEAIALELEQALGQLPPVTVLGLDHVTADEHKNAKTIVPVKARGAERKVEFYRNQWTLMRDSEKLKQGHHVVTWYHTKINAALPRPEFSVEIVHEPGRLTIHEQTMEASPEAVERLPIGKQNVLYVRHNPGATARDIAIAVRGSDERTKVVATQVELRREAGRGEVWQREGHWYPAGHPGNENIGHESESEEGARLPYPDA